MDFEVAMWQACSSVFPSSRLHGCFFHFSQALWRKVQEIGLASEYNNDPTIKRLLRHLFGLPFLPIGHIPRAFRLLSASANTGKLRRLFRYVSNTWIEGDMWRPFDWSVYGRQVRTNNDVEGWHNRLNTKAFKGNLPFYCLIKLLYEESRICKIKKKFFAVGKLPIYRKRRYVHMNNRIMFYWRQFRNRRLSPMELLRKCAATYCPSL